MRKTFLLLLLFSFPLFAQDSEPIYSGLIAPTEEEYLKTEQAKMIRSYSDKADAAFKSLPAQVDLARDLPQAGDQGKQNSCVGWTVAYAVKSFQEERELGWGLSQHLFSPSFLYNQLNHGKDEGLDLGEAIRFVMEHGLAPLSMAPYDATTFTKKPDATAKETARGFKALGYRRLDETNVNHLRAYLAGGEPVMLIIEMFPSFLKRAMKATNSVYPGGTKGSLGYHAIVAVGYDDAKKQVKILNSWGSSWGQNGYGWIPYDVYAKVNKRAYVMYDTPTLLSTVAKVNPAHGEKLARKASPNSKSVAVVNTPTSPAVTAGTQTSQDNNMILVVPDEAGVYFDNKWSRLGDNFDSAKNNIPLPPAPALPAAHFGKDLIFPDKVGKIALNSGSVHPVYTNQGVTFGTPKEDVHRIYKAPDTVDETNRTETYFYHAVASDWGGVKVTKHASLLFTYAPDGTVSDIQLESVFKDVKMGETRLQPVATTASPQGGQNITSADGKLSFWVPDGFSDMKQSDWKEQGYGYFIKNPTSIMDFMAVKVFFTDKDDPAVLDQRVETELKTYSLGNLPKKKEEFAGLTWVLISANSQGRRYYAMKGKTIFQIQLSSSKPLEQTPWLTPFLNSVSVK